MANNVELITTNNEFKKQNTQQNKKQYRKNMRK